MEKISIVAARVLGRLRGLVNEVSAQFRSLSCCQKICVSLALLALIVLGGLLVSLSWTLAAAFAALAMGVALGILIGRRSPGPKESQLVRELANARQELDQLRIVLREKLDRITNLENELRRIQLRLETLLATIPDIVVEVDRNFVFTAANPAALRFYGNDLLGREAREFLYYPQPVYDRSLPLLSGEAEALYLEDWLRRRDGACRLVAWHARALRSPDGEIVGILGVGRDITDLRELEEENKSKSDLFTAVASAAQDGVVLIDQQGQVTFWNQSATRIFGYSAEEMLGKDVHRVLCPPELLPVYEKNYIVFARTGQGPVVGRTLRLEAIRKDKTRVPIELSVGAYRLHGRWCAVAVIRDITKQQALESNLRDSEARYRFLAENIDDVIWTTDSQWRITYVNEAVRSYLGFEPEKLLGQDLTALFPPEASEFIKEFTRAEQRNGESSRPVATTIVDHQTAWQFRRSGQVRIKPLQDEAGQFCGLLGVSRIILPTEGALRPAEEESPVAEFFDALLTLARKGARVDAILAQTEMFLKSARLLAPNGSVGLCRPRSTPALPFASAVADSHSEQASELQQPGQPQSLPESLDNSAVAHKIGAEAVSCCAGVGSPGVGRSDCAGWDAVCHSQQAPSYLVNLSSGEFEGQFPFQNVNAEKLADSNLLVPIFASSGEVLGVLCCQGVISGPEVRRIVTTRVVPILSLVLAREEDVRQTQALRESLARKSRYLRAFLDLGSWCSAIKWDEIVDEQDLLNKIVGVFSQCVPGDYLNGVRVVLFGKEASSVQFCDSLFKLAAPIYWNGQLVGAIEVSLPAARAENLDPYRWQEEQLYLTHLVNLLSQILGHHLSRFAMSTTGYWAAHAYATTSGN